MLTLRLFLLRQQAVLNHQIVHLRAHKTPIRILGRTDNRLPAHIKRRIHEHRTARLCFKRSQQRVIFRIRFRMNRLNPRRIVHMRHRRNRRMRHFQLLNAKQRILPAICLPQILLHARHQRHIRTRVRSLQLKIIARPLRQHRRRKRTKRLPILNL